MCSSIPPGFEISRIGNELALLDERPDNVSIVSYRSAVSETLV